MLVNTMIDLETMSTAKTAAILSIGAVKFDIEEEKIIGEFYQNVELSSCIHLGMHTMQDTLDWWAKDSQKEARDTLTKDAVELDTALLKFLDWINDEGIIPWANGATFDIPILENAFKVCRRPVPWKFYNESCYRTFKRMYPSILVSRDGMKHNALDDAKYQAKHLMRILKSLKLSEDGR
jgi:DNA polymerase III epsilon subunit-like protein